MIRPVLRLAGVLETASLLALLVNLIFVHQQAFAAALGPIHGIIYLVVVILSLLLPIPVGPRLLGLVPGIGGLLVSRAAAGSDGAAKPPPSYW